MLFGFFSFASPISHWSSMVIPDVLTFVVGIFRFELDTFIHLLTTF